MSKKYIAAVDLGGTNLKVALLDDKYKIKARQVLGTRRFRRKEELIAAIARSVTSIIAAGGIKKTSLIGIGLGLPGPVDHKNGIVHFFPNIPGWAEVDLKAILCRKLRLPVFLDNDAKLMALAEQRLGRAARFKNVLCLTLGTGVGGGLILGGELFRGANNCAGEFGHLPINEFGPSCNCGGIACLESYIGNNRIRRNAREIFGRSVTLEELSALAKMKNKKALKLWQDAGRHLAVALAAAVNLLNLDAVVIGGGVANAGEILFSQVRETVRLRAMSVQGRHVKIFKARLGGDAGLIGAGILVKESV